MHIYIVDPAYGSLLGHSLDYDNNIVAELKKRNIKSTIISRKNNLNLSDDEIQVFSENEWGFNKQENSENNYFSSNIKFYKELSGFFQKQVTYDFESILLFPNVTNFNLAGIANIIQEYKNKFEYKIILRYPYSYFESRTSINAIESLNRMAHLGIKIDILTDSHLLQAEYIKFFDIKVRQIPIPISPVTSTCEVSSTNQKMGKITIGALGNPRIEKGFDKLFNFITYEPVREGIKNFQFKIQAHEPDSSSKKYVELLTKIAEIDNNICLFKEPLDYQKYSNLISDCGIILNLYDKRIYSERTSGPFLESLIQGKIVITTAGTWMSEIYKFYEIDLYIDDSHPNVVYNKIKKIESEFDNYQEKLNRLSVELRKKHNPSAFIDVLLDKQVTDFEFPYGRKAFILYPWVQTVSGRNGAHSILKAHISYLESNHDSIFVLGQGNEKYDFDGVLKIESYQSKINESSYLHDHLVAKYGEEADYSEIMHIWHFCWPSEDIKFSRIIRHYVGTSDTVFIDYPYFINILKDILKDRLIASKTHLFLHDVLYQQLSTKNKLKQKLHELEIENIRGIKNVYSFSYEDQAEFKKYNLDIQHIDVPLMPGKPKKNSHSVKKTILFVGTKHSPNTEAVTKLISYIENLGEDDIFNEFKFVIIGSCCEISKGKNWLSLGSVDSETLKFWYEESYAVLNLQENGTGISIKTAEAIMEEKLVISTPNGVRGLGLIKGQNYIEIESVANLKTALTQLQDNPTVIQEVMKNNKAFMIKHHFQAAHEKVLNLECNKKINYKNKENKIPDGVEINISKILFKIDVQIAEFNEKLIESRMGFIKFISELDFHDSPQKFNDLDSLVTYLGRQEIRNIQDPQVVKVSGPKSFNYYIFSLLINDKFEGLLTIEFDIEESRIPRIQKSIIKKVKIFSNLFFKLKSSKNTKIQIFKKFAELNSNPLLFSVTKKIFKYYKKIKFFLTK
jgi:glycosyltransferase involved in cell wall biosynthesis